MAWQTPRTWSPGETVTASIMNAHVRDQLNALEPKAIIIGLGSVGGGDIPTGLQAYIEIPMSLTITGWTLVASEFDSDIDLVIDVWKTDFASFPPTVSDTIAGTEKPTLSGEQAAQDLSLSTWDADLDAGDVIAINIDSISLVEQATLTLRCIPR